MKKKTFMMICLAILGIQVSKAQQSIIALHHEGNVTIFSGSKTQEAMDASVKGDTLYLSEGTFAGWNVTHGIVVLGSGERSVVSGNITITGNDENKDLGGYVFSGLNLLHDFVVNDSVNGLRLSQCNMNTFEVKDNAIIDGAEIVMCYFRSFFSVGGSEDDITVLSSKINIVSYGGNKKGSVSFNHCNIIVAQDGDSETQYRNTYLNCIIMYANCSTFLRSIYSRTGYYPNHFDGGREPDLQDGCVKAEFSFDDKLNCSLPDDTLKARGYLGDDGTVVGITGGECPFTLELATPHIVDHKVDVDNVNRKLTVTLKMAHEATKEDE